MIEGGNILLFQVGARLFGCAVSEVGQIGAGAADLEAERVERTVLGPPFQGTRSLVVSCADAKRELVIDQVVGVRSVAAEELRDVPPLAAACLGTRAIRALAIFDDAITPIIDLPALLTETARSERPHDES